MSCCGSTSIESSGLSPCIQEVRPFARRSSVQAHPALRRPTMASADSSKPVPAHRWSGSPDLSGQTWRPPRVSPVSFPRSPPDLPTPRPGSFRASSYLADSPHLRGPSIRFLFVRAVVRLRLPSDPASRRAPLPSAIRFAATSVRLRLSLQIQGMPGTQEGPLRHAQGPFFRAVALSVTLVGR